MGRPLRSTQAQVLQPRAFGLRVESVRGGDCCLAPPTRVLNASSLSVRGCARYLSGQTLTRPPRQYNSTHYNSENPPPKGACLLAESVCC